GAARVAGEAGCVGRGPGLAGMRCREADDRARSREKLLRRAAEVSRLLEVAHAGMQPRVDPAREALEARGRTLDPGDAAARESLGARLFAEDPSGQQAIGRRHPMDASIRPQEIVLPSNDRFSSRVFNLVVLAVIGYLLFRIIEPFLDPIFWAVLLALIIFPLNSRLRRRLRGRKGLAATVLTVGVQLRSGLPFAAVAVAFARQGVELGHRLSSIVDEYRIGGVEDLLRVPAIGKAAAWLQNKFGLDAGRIQVWLAKATTSV